MENWICSFDYKHLQMYQILVLNNLWGVDVPLNKSN